MEWGPKFFHLQWYLCEMCVLCVCAVHTAGRIGIRRFWGMLNVLGSSGWEDGGQDPLFASPPKQCLATLFLDSFCFSAALSSIPFDWGWIRGAIFPWFQRV